MKQNERVEKLSKKQLEVAEMLANPEIDTNKSKIIAASGVSRSTFYRWLKDSEFIKYVDSLIEKYTDAELANVWKKLIYVINTRADVQAIKLFMELKGRYKQDVKITSEVKNNPLEGLTTEELKKLIENA